MKKLLTILLIVSGFAAQAQYPSPIFTKANNVFGGINNRGKFDSALYIPTGCGAPTDTTFLLSQGTNPAFPGFGQKYRTGALYWDSCGHKLYGHDGIGSWILVSSSSGTFDTTTIYRILGTKVDTATFNALAALVAGNMVNFGGAPGMMINSYASRPAANTLQTGTVYIAPDSAHEYVDTGSGGTAGWKQIGGSSGGGGGGSQTLPQVLTTGRTMDKSYTVNLAGYRQYDSAGLQLLDSVGIIPAKAYSDSIVVVGTSISQGILTYPNNYANLFAYRINAGLVNLGLSSAQLCLYGISDTNAIPIYDPKKYRWFISEWGINDMQDGTYDSTTFSNTYILYIGAILRRGWPLNKIVILQNGTCNCATSAKQLQFRQAISAVVAAEGITHFVDIYDGEVSNSTNGGLDFLLPDQLHPNVFGTNLYMRMIARSTSDSVYSQGQQAAFNGLTEVQHLKFRGVDTGDYRSTPLGLDTAGNVVRMKFETLVRATTGSYPTSTPNPYFPQPGGINMAGTAFLSHINTMIVTSPTNYDSLNSLYVHFQTVLGNILTVADDATINGMTVGRGGGNFASNTVVGNGALSGNTGDNGNTGVGSQALADDNTGFFNTAIGLDALNALQTGNQNVAVGVQALNSVTGSGNVGIGSQAGSSITSSSNKLYIANSSANNLLYGDFAAGRLQINGGSTPSFLTSDNFIVNGSSYFSDSVVFDNVRNGLSTDSVAVLHQLSPGKFVVHKVAQSFGGSYTLAQIVSGGNVVGFSLNNGVTPVDSVIFAAITGDSVALADTAAVIRALIAGANIYVSQGLEKYGADTLIFGGILSMPDTLDTKGHPLLILNLPSVASPISTDSVVGEHINGQLFKTPVPSGGSSFITSLTTTGSGAATVATGVLNIPTPSATPPAGSNTQVQFNNSGAFGASSSLTWASSTLTTAALTATSTTTLATASTNQTACATCVILVKDSATGIVKHETAVQGASATYTPSVTNGTNTTASGTPTGTYIRMGTFVFVQVTFGLTITTTNTNSNVIFSLPITSSLSSSAQYGTASVMYSGSGASSVGNAIQTSTTQATVQFYPTQANGSAYTVSVTYIYSL